LSLSSKVVAAASEAAPGRPLQPVYFQKIKIDGFWKTQFKRLTEKWIPHCIEQMEAGGQGQELLNLIHTGKALKGEPHGEFTGRPWSDAYILFYLQGYFIEMGVAHYRITGGADRRLYDAALRCADHLCETFGPPPKRVSIHGHAGMGYALCRLARLVNEAQGPGEGDKYFQLAKFLLDTRHTVEEHRSAYHQSQRLVQL
jgi:DUF1680 family protein